jgi:hypothetical protein
MGISWWQSPVTCQYSGKEHIDFPLRTAFSLSVQLMWAHDPNMAIWPYFKSLPPTIGSESSVSKVGLIRIHTGLFIRTIINMVLLHWAPKVTKRKARLAGYLSMILRNSWLRMKPTESRIQKQTKSNQLSKNKVWASLEIPHSQIFLSPFNSSALPSRNEH